MKTEMLRSTQSENVNFDNAKDAELSGIMQSEIFGNERPRFLQPETV